MIQRVQTIYLLLCITCLSFVIGGTKIVSFLSDSSSFDVYAYGIQRQAIDTGFQEADLRYAPWYAIAIRLVLIAVVTLISYKNLKRQLKFGRMLFYTYFFVLISTLILLYLGESQMGATIEKRELGLGFIFLVAGFPFTFLANTGIKRDKKLLDSLNRLR